MLIESVSVRMTMIRNDDCGEKGEAGKRETSRGWGDILFITPNNRRKQNKLKIKNKSNRNRDLTKHQSTINIMNHGNSTIVVIVN
jgi:hypothetical protein